MTMRFVASMTFALALTERFAPDRSDLVAVDEHVGQRQVAELWIEGQHVAALDQGGSIRIWASADHRCLPALLELRAA
jgi:hypothetical protein